MRKRAFLAAFCLLLFLIPLLPVPAEEEVEDVTNQCTLSSSMKNDYWIPRVTDDDLATAQFFGEKGYVQASWKKSVPVKYLYVEWKELPDSFTVLYYDEGGRLLSEEQGRCTLLHQVFYLEAGVQSICLQGDSLNISTFKLCSGDTLPHNYHEWEELTGKLDYLIIAMHPDDDTLFMGGIAPTLSNKGLRGTIVYLGTRMRQRCTEALNGAWDMGVRVQPILAGFPDIPDKKENTEIFESAFPEYAVTRYLTSLFRQYQPEVVFTHDINGEYGHWQHKRLSAATRKAVKKAADPTFDPESAEQYGVWTVKKLYLHLYEENSVHISMTEPLEAHGGRTAWEMAAEAFQEHISQLGGRHACTNQGVYSLEDFGLYYTTVGWDAEKNDFMENIDPTTLTNYVSPAPTSEPTSEPTAEPTPESTCTPAPTAIPQKEAAAPAEVASEGRNISGLLLLVAGILLVAAGAGLIIAKR